LQKKTTKKPAPAIKVIKADEIMATVKDLAEDLKFVKEYLESPGDFLPDAFTEWGTYIRTTHKMTMALQEASMSVMKENLQQAFQMRRLTQVLIEVAKRLNVPVEDLEAEADQIISDASEDVNVTRRNANKVRKASLEEVKVTVSGCAPKYGAGESAE
jgi:hypothetical protein